MINKKNILLEQGLTLVELLVGIVVGLVVLSAAGGAMMSYMTAYNKSTQIINLNQNMRALMDLMARDIRRAGYVTVNPDNFSQLKSNKFFMGLEDINVYSYDGKENSCIVFSYNKNIDLIKNEKNEKIEDFQVKNNEVFGFRLESGVLQMKNGGSHSNGCTWQSSEKISDDENVVIESLSFTLSPSSCSSNSICSRQVIIEMKGGIKNDKSIPPISHTLVQTIKIRNDKFL